jgi:hypothetical protein
MKGIRLNSYKSYARFASGFEMRLCFLMKLRMSRH